MSDFYSTDPHSCEGLGSKLKNIQVSGVSGSVSGVPNTCIEFDVGDWYEEDKYYFIDILPDQHNQGLCASASVHERVSGVSGDCYAEVGMDGILYKDDGTIRLRVICLPDCRFIGRVVIDG